jgi:ArsR family transcriptional regulator
MNPNDEKSVSSLHRAMAIVKALAQAAETGLRVSELCRQLGLTQPTVTHHLQKLAAAGLVVGERRGTWTWYRVVPGALTGLADAIAPAASRA